MKFAKIFILINALVFFIYGLLFLIFPVESSNWVVDTSPSTSSGLIDMRATYGGLAIAVGIIFYLLASKPSTIKIGLISVTVTLAAMALGRFIGIVIDTNPNPNMYIYLTLEIVFAVMGAIVIIQTKEH